LSALLESTMKPTTLAALRVRMVGTPPEKEGVYPFSRLVTLPTHVGG